MEEIYHEGGGEKWKENGGMLSFPGYGPNYHIISPFCNMTG